MGTSHLESTWQCREERANQLDTALRLMAGPDSVLMGDLNLSGTEGVDLIAKHRYADQWLLSHPSDPVHIFNRHAYVRVVSALLLFLFILFELSTYYLLAGLHYELDIKFQYSDQISFISSAT